MGPRTKPRIHQKLSETETEMRTAYEVSILKLKRREENEGIY